MTDREILKELVDNKIKATKMGYDFYDIGNALTQLRAYYREKIKKVMPKKKEIPDWNKAIPNPTDYQRGLQQGLFDGIMEFNRAIDAILKEIEQCL